MAKYWEKVEENIFNGCAGVVFQLKSTLTDKDKIKALGTLGLTPKDLETTDIVVADETGAQKEGRGIGENTERNVDGNLVTEVDAALPLKNRINWENELRKDVGV
jgi:hypothetical protein